MYLHSGSQAENAKPWSLLFSWVMVKVQEGFSTNLPCFSTQKWHIKTSIYILLVKVSHIARPQVSRVKMYAVLLGRHCKDT
jgi:hypothetical protein